MMPACPPPSPTGQFVYSLIGYIDCQTGAMAQSSHYLTAIAGTIATPLIFGALQIFVALFGYRMMLGETPALRQLVMAMVRIGMVLTLTLGWAAYQTLAHDVVTRAPAELARPILSGSSELEETRHGLARELQDIDDAMAELARAPTPRQAGDDPASEDGSAENSAPAQAKPDQASTGIETARFYFLVGAAAPYVAVHLVAALLLALGPLFLLLMLFEATRDLFESWLRVLIWTVLANVAITLMLALELSFYRPWLAELLRVGADGTAEPVTLAACAQIFALATMAILAALTLLAVRGGRWPVLRAVTRHAERLIATALPQPISAAPSGAPLVRPGALTVSNALIVQQRRDDAAQHTGHRLAFDASTTGTYPRPAESGPATNPRRIQARRSALVEKRETAP